jgi:hypothetical protein
MKSLVRGFRNMVCSKLRRAVGTSSGTVWLIAAAFLFLIGAIANGAAGSRDLTEIGVLGTVVAIAFVAAFMG